MKRNKLNGLIKMNKFILTPLAIALSLTLSACGGSSSDGNSASSLNGGSTAQLQTISLQALTRQCGTDSAYQTDVVFHNDDGDAIGSVKTDAQGNFSGELPSGTRHVSLLGDVVDETDGGYKQIFTELDIENRANLGKFYFNNFSEGCGCTEYNVDTTALSTIASDYTIYQSQGNEVSGSVNICPSDNKLYLTALSRYSVDAKAAVIDVPVNSSVITLTDEDFIHDGVEVPVQLDFNADYSSTRGYIEAENTYQFVQYSFSGISDTLFIFPTVTEHNSYVQFDFMSDPMNVDGVEVDIHSYARSAIETDGDYQLTELPTITDDLGFSLLQITENNDASFDFSNVDNRFARTTWGYSFLVDDAAESRFDWTIRGGISGQIPDLSFGSIFPEPTDEVILEELTLLLYGYAGNATDANSYAQLLDTISEGGHLTKPEFSNYVYIFIGAELY